MSNFSTAHEVRAKPDRGLMTGSGKTGPVQLPEWFPESIQEQPRALRDAIGALRRDRVRRRAFRQRLDPIGDPLRGLAKLRDDGPVGGVSLGHVVGSLATARRRSNKVASCLRAVSLDLVQDLAQMPEFLVGQEAFPHLLLVLPVRHVPNCRPLPGAMRFRNGSQGMRDADRSSISSICSRSVRSSVSA